MNPFLVFKPFTLVLAAALLTVASAQAAAYVKFDGVEGESADANHDKWIDVLSIDWGAHKPGGGATGQSRRRGGVIVEDMRLTLNFDKAAPKLQEKCLMGEVIPKLEIELLRPEPNSADGSRAVYLKYKLERCFIKSWSISGNSDAAGILVEVSFETMSETYVDGEGNETTLTVEQRRGGKARLEETPGRE